MRVTFVECKDIAMRDQRVDQVRHIHEDQHHRHAQAEVLVAQQAPAIGSIADGVVEEGRKQQADGGEDQQAG